MRKLTLLSALLWASAAHAAIQYAGGTNVNALCTAAAGTKQELSDCVEDELAVAGWTVVSGSHSSTVLLQSLATPTAGLQMRLQLTQGTNCLILKGRNVGNTKAAANGQFLLPGIGVQFRVIANKFQYFITLDGALGSSSRSAAAGGVLYVPTFVGITEAIWTTGVASTDSDATGGSVLCSWRNALNMAAATGCSVWVTVNGTQYETQSISIDANGFGIPDLLTPQSTRKSLSTDVYRWFDGSAFITEPLISIGTSRTTEGKVSGQLWDAAIITDSMASGTSLTFDSHNWLAFTNSGAGTPTLYAKGTLALVVP